MHKDFEKYWSKLKRRFKLLLLASIVIPLVTGVLLLLSIANIAHLTIPFAFWVVYTVSIASLQFLWNSKLFWNNQMLIQFLHQKYPEMEYSLSVFFKKDLNSLEKLQQAKIFKQLPSIQNIGFPIPLKNVFILLIFSGLFYSTSFFYQMEKPTAKQSISTENNAGVEVDSDNEIIVENFAYQLKVYPPSYTSLRSFEWQADKKIPEGSRLVFANQGNIHFDLLWQNQYDFSLKENQSKTFVLNQSSIFQIDYRQNDSLVSLKPEILEMKRDEPPILSTNLKDNRHEIEWEELNKDFKLELNLEDDYGIISTDIVMTLSRGEGEAVKFREMKQSIRGISQRLQQQQKSISLPMDTFSLEPGDELYFYFSAKDNKKPKANTGKTDVYFISVADTTESDPVEYEGFALTNEAEYFKSQRQIIIDTEKLLADQNQITQEEFEQRSNSIGADQKLLRLRYGVFLGEEFETTGGLGEVDHTGHDHGDLEGEDEDHEGHDYEEQESESNFSNPIYNETPELEAYVHSHDESELSTFLDADVKAKLKAALTNMWEAELFLRTYKPKEALPFEYEALKLIKEVKRASRIYVERMGFEPPPIDEEKKRLTGDLDKIDAKTTEDELLEKPFEEKLAETYTDLKAAYQLGDLEKAEVVVGEFTDDLVAKITSQPVRYGSLLSAIKQFQNTKSKSKLGEILIIMEDMLPISVLENANNEKSIKTSLHKTYYDLLNE